MDLDRLKRLIGFSGPKDETKAGALRRYLRVGAIVLGVVIVNRLVLPLFINVNSFRPKIESEASAALGRQVCCYLPLFDVSSRVFAAT